MKNDFLTCPWCQATAHNTSKERGRFKRRHGKNCLKRERQEFAKQLAQSTRSVNADAPAEFEGRNV